MWHKQKYYSSLFWGDPRIIPHIIKPMLWKGDMDDLSLLDARFHAAVGGFSFRNQEISPENFPCEIHRSISLLISQYGCDRIALVGYCWVILLYNEQYIVY